MQTCNANGRHPAFDTVSLEQRLDGQHLHSHTRYDFITQLESEISKPVLPFEKQRAYIATQIIAEYLREYFECDAVIFRSSMHKGDEADNRNIVIFYRGIGFVGKDALLGLSKHHVTEVRDATYKTTSWRL